MATESDIYNIYIDEAGDEGFKFDGRRGHGSSDFFVLSALIVKKKDDINLAHIVNEIKTILNYQPKDMESPLHFYKLAHEKRKVCVSKLVNFKYFYSITIVFNKKELHKVFEHKQILYNYACKLLLERIIIFLKSQNSNANLIFEHRRNTKYEDLLSYISKTLSHKDKYVLSAKALTKAQSKCLQLADIIASSTYKAFEPNQYDGDIESSYIESLCHNIYAHQGRILGYGLKIFPQDMPLIEQEKYEWLNKLLHSGLKK